MKKFKVINNFFNDNEISEIKYQIEDIFTSKEILKSAKGDWDPDLITSQGDVDRYALDPTIDSEVYDIIYYRMKEEFNMTPKGIIFHYWNHRSYINWHEDASHGGAATIYLNEKWNRDYGGYFVYEKDNKFGLEIPKFNKCVFQSGGIPHATTPVADNAPIRKSLQVFFK